MTCTAPSRSGADRRASIEGVCWCSGLDGPGREGGGTWRAVGTIKGGTGSREGRGGVGDEGYSLRGFIAARRRARRPPRHRTSSLPVLGENRSYGLLKQVLVLAGIHGYCAVDSQHSLLMIAGIQSGELAAVATVAPKLQYTQLQRS